jgi:glutamate-5-semialdehyde dehydrogenase
MNVTDYMQGLGKNARAAASSIAAASSGTKNDALEAIAVALDAARESLASQC